MASAITIDVLPADRGDALWVECHRRSGRPWRLLFDGGMPSTWPVVRERVLALERSERMIDLVVVSHIDSDHIGGILPLLAATDVGARFGDIWFNGLPQLPDSRGGGTRGVTEGESLVHLLSGSSTGPASLPWNQAFDGRPVMTAGEGEFLEVAHPGDPRITLLSPTPLRLIELRQVWSTELDQLHRGEPVEPPAPAERRAPLDDLEELAATHTAPDDSVANGSSIAFLLEYGGASCLLAADAFAPVLIAALGTLANSRGGRGRSVEIDVFKLPHHGSKGNVTAPLVALAPARNYVVSTNGERFHHPDDIALARVVTSAPRGIAITFNYTTPATARWSDPKLAAEYQYDVVHPAEMSAPGTRVELPGT